MPVRGCAEEQALIGEIARGIFKARPETSIAILGGVSDDTGMMAHTNAFVTGAIETQEFARARGFAGREASIRRLNAAFVRPSDSFGYSRHAARCCLFRLVGRPLQA